MATDDIDIMQVSEAQNIPLLAIVGPTAAGKTALAIELAQRLGGEIVSADSRQVYRHMDIGTAKPTTAERAVVPHHLIDVVDPDADFSLGLYQELATAAIADIAGRGKLPLLVGGTGQYLAAVLQGWEVPRVAPQPELRAALEREAQAAGVAALHSRLAQVDLDRPPRSSRLTSGESFALWRSTRSPAGRSPSSRLAARRPTLPARSG
jgi:tRNA dimethylallyltransferase